MFDDNIIRQKLLTPFASRYNSGKTESRRPSGKCQTDRSRSQSQSNRGSTRRPCNKLSNTYHAYSYDDDVYQSRGITPSFYISKYSLVCTRSFKLLLIYFLFFLIFGDKIEQTQTLKPCLISTKNLVQTPCYNTAGSSNVRSTNYGTNDDDDDEYRSRGIIL